MAFDFAIARSGDDYILGDNMHTKVPKSGYTAVVGDVVFADETIANGVDLIAGTEAPFGIVEKVEATGLLTVIEFVPGTYITLPFTGSLAKGERVKYSSNTRDVAISRTKVQVATGTDGGGSVVATGAETAYGTGFAVVRF